MRWYADNSELNGIRASELPDILIFGGIVVQPDIEKDLQDSIQKVKKKYCHRERAPIKWNFKDLKQVYRQQKMPKIYEMLIESSDAWRREIFETIQDFDFCIIIACIESNSLQRKVIAKLKQELTSYVFSNGLMRYGLHVRDCKPNRAQVILDWPDRSDPKPFNFEYASAYNNGKTLDHGIPYACGKLSSLNFADSPAFASMNYSCLLQLSDLIVGATREFIEYSLGKKTGGLGVDILKNISSRFRGAPNNIFGRGISVASKDNEFKNKIKNAIMEKLQK